MIKYFKRPCIFHVFTPALMYRLSPNPEIDLPLMALRFKPYTEMYLFDEIDCLGPSKLDLIDPPLPGTDGRGVAVMFTDHLVRCHYRSICPKIACPEGRDPKDIMQEVMSLYRRTDQLCSV